MKPWLNVKMLGLPRWAWIAMGVGGVGLGLYLRAHNAEGETEATEEEEEGAIYTPRAQSLEAYEGTDTAGGLQALGAAGPMPTATQPVAAPYIPEGFPETLGSQGDVVQGLANGVLENSMAGIELASILASERPTREVVRERIGSTPRRPVAHRPPRTRPKRKKAPHKPKGKRAHKKVNRRGKRR